MKFDKILGVILSIHGGSWHPEHPQSIPRASPEQASPERPQNVLERPFEFSKNFSTSQSVLERPKAFPECPRAFPQCPRAHQSIP